MDRVSTPRRIGQLPLSRWSRDDSAAGSSHLGSLPGSYRPYGRQQLPKLIARQEAAMLQRQAATVILVAVLAGCAPERAVPERTGASQCMHSFFQALVEKDWPRGYALLDPQSKRLWSERRFAQSASRYLA